MDPIGLPIASSVAGAAQSERDSVREKRKAEAESSRRLRRDADGADLSLHGVESAEAVRSAKGNDQEEAHEDRQEHAWYAPDGSVEHARRPRLDLEG